MLASHLIKLALFGLGTIIFSLKKPILGTIIVTDYCNLECRHCAVNNINKVMYPYNKLRTEMENFYSEGIRILFISGGETMLWQDGEYSINDLIHAAREIGFYLINIVTNGTVRLRIPEADLVFLSLDGLRETHDSIRGETFSRIMENVADSGDTNICVFTAINRLNYTEIEGLCELTESNPRLNSISFNFHTPYRMTENLCLNPEEKARTVGTIKKMMDRGFPIFNLRSALDRYLNNNWSRPCYQCIVSENDIRYVCGRCSVIEGLCEQCGYLFAVEFSTLFSGDFRAIAEMFRTYTRYV